MIRPAPFAIGRRKLGKKHMADDKTPSSTRGKAKEKARHVIGRIPAPSANPVTNLIITDIVLRATSRLMRRSVERVFIGAKHSPREARAVLSSGTFAKSLASSAIARFATRSPPGAMLVGGALIAKVLYDRAQDKRTRRRGSTQAPS